MTNNIENINNFLIFFNKLKNDNSKLSNYQLMFFLKLLDKELENNPDYNQYLINEINNNQLVINSPILSLLLLSQKEFKELNINNKLFYNFISHQLENDFNEKNHQEIYEYLFDKIKQNNLLDPLIFIHNIRFLCQNEEKFNSMTQLFELFHNKFFIDHPYFNNSNLSFINDIENINKLINKVFKYKLNKEEIEQISFFNNISNQRDYIFNSSYDYTEKTISFLYKFCPDFKKINLILKLISNLDYNSNKFIDCFNNLILNEKDDSIDYFFIDNPSKKHLTHINKFTKPFHLYLESINKHNLDINKISKLINECDINHYMSVKALCNLYSSNLNPIQLDKIIENINNKINSETVITMKNNFINNKELYKFIYKNKIDEKAIILLCDNSEEFNILFEKYCLQNTNEKINFNNKEKNKFKL